MSYVTMYYMECFCGVDIDFTVKPGYADEKGRQYFTINHGTTLITECSIHPKYLNGEKAITTNAGVLVAKMITGMNRSGVCPKFDDWLSAFRVLQVLTNDE